MVKRLGGALVFAAAVVACGSSSSRSASTEGRSPADAASRALLLAGARDVTVLTLAT